MNASCRHRPRARIAGGARGPLWLRLPAAVLVWLALAAPAAAGGAALVVIHRAGADLPEVPDLERHARTTPQTSEIEAADGTIAARVPFSQGGVVGHRDYVPYAEIPRLVIRAFVAAEDRRFFDHAGVDVAAIARAARANIRAGRVVEGGSTITQQLARALRPDAIGREETLDRKLREALLAREIERSHSKPQILEAYINEVFLGAGAYGAAAGARAYFDKSLAELEPAEAALIAGLVQAPSRATPFTAPERARARRDEVLRRMREAGFLTHSAHRRAREAELGLRPAEPRYGRVAPWHTERARREVAAALPEAYARGGLRIETAAEPALAAAGAERAREHADQLARAGEAPELAAVLWDHRTNYVELSIGGRDFGESSFDRANQACRQPGSAFKPIAYAAALAAGAITPGTPLRDAPVTEYDADVGAFWKPDTGGRRFRGVALAREALALSLNAPAVEVFQRAGARRVTAMARRLGLETDLEAVAPLALGSSCVVPVELTAAYATFARGGETGEPVYVTRVTRGEEVLFDRRSPLDPDLDAAGRLERLWAEQRESPERALDEIHSFLMVDMLAAVVERGTGADARALGRPVAGKTGSTNDHVDAWFVGFTGRLAGAVWVGHDDPSASLGPGRSGARAALPLWIDLVARAESERPEAPIRGEPPEGVVRAHVDPETGRLAPANRAGRTLYFEEGTEPEAKAEGASGAGRSLDEAAREF